MDTMEKSENSENLFAALVYSLYMTAMQQLGAVANPMSGHKECDLIQAKISIEMIDMLAAKTVGHLSEYEADFIRKSIEQLHQLFDQASP